MNRRRGFFLCALAAVAVWACAQPEKEWFGLADRAGNPVSSPVRARGELYAAYKTPRGTTDKIAFELYFKDEAGGWKLIFLNIQQSDTPAALVREPLVVEDLPPGAYKIVFIRNDKPIGETVFELLATE
ncbi:MAG: hypothetical protein A3G34_05790 [Candidatus Lindowbacteria bacterium RIFCSPLOWO2_12_FULL_62_27]|nr:MAG: hypothetical protein A3I06_13460 [Candidatus Lindowbacteria bacterium RIFCSPLOWO2_02_FULL_62_12]OGH59932.1 MAG: hypothetical protein A3G34_05790 [Candidatus Lindowbacteria bacterium RIFCSPLOWO2_12_FULL_62_27]